MALTRDELHRPFAGSVVGLTWAVLHPLAVILLYLLVFAAIFRIRLGPTMSADDYAVYLIAGLLSWMAWSAVITGSCHSIVANAGLVKQAHFPAEVLPMRSVLLALVSQLIGLAVLLVYVVGRTRTLSWTFLMIPVAVSFQALAMLGAAYFLAAAAVFVRDVKELSVLFVTAGIYLVPAFYTPSMLAHLPWPLRGAITSNPLSVYLDLFRDCLLASRPVRPASWVAAGVIALVLPAVGRRVFNRLHVFFGNFL